MRDVMLIVHFIGLAMGLGTSLAFLFLGMASAKMEKPESEKFILNAMVLSKMGNIGLVLLFLSGGYLMTPYWSNLTSMPLLMIKLALFLVLGALIGIIHGKARKARIADTGMHLQSIEKLGKLTLPVAIAIVILAVYVFH